jgi:hypothetical protein
MTDSIGSAMNSASLAAYNQPLRSPASSGAQSASAAAGASSGGATAARPYAGSDDAAIVMLSAAARNQQPAPAEAELPEETEPDTTSSEAGESEG